MATANGTASLPFSLEVACTSSTLGDAFVHEGGDKLLIELLKAAGLARGAWVYRAKEAFTSRGESPVIQVRHWDVYGVHVWVRADGNKAVKGVLHIPKDIGLKPAVAYDKLYAVNGGTPGELIPQPRHKIKAAEIAALSDGKMAPVVTVAEGVLLLMAVDELTREAFKAARRDDYVAELCSRLGAMWPLDQVDKQLLLLVRCGLLIDMGSYHAITPEGRLRMEQEDDFRHEVSAAKLLADLPKGADVSPPPRPTAPSAPPIPPPSSPVSPPTVDVDLGAILAANESKLKKLMELGAKLAASRKRQKDLTDQVNKLQLDIEKEKQVERQLAAGVDVDSLTKLFSAVK